MKLNDPALCLFTSGLMAGTGLGISAFAVAAIKASNDPLPSFKRLYKNGSKTAITLIFATTGLSLKCFIKTEDVRYLLVTGVFSLIPAYTLGLMKPINDELFSIKDNKYLEDEEEVSRVRRLITKWDKFQYGRTALGMLGFALTCWIATKKAKY